MAIAPRVGVSPLLYISATTVRAKGDATTMAKALDVSSSTA
jgi:hypothetical protein